MARGELSRAPVCAGRGVCKFAAAYLAATFERAKAQISGEGGAEYARVGETSVASRETSGATLQLGALGGRLFYNLTRGRVVRPRPGSRWRPSRTPWPSPWETRSSTPPITICQPVARSLIGREAATAMHPPSRCGGPRTSTPHFSTNRQVSDLRRAPFRFARVTPKDRPPLAPRGPS
jgi:hypothetical protein